MLTSSKPIYPESLKKKIKITEKTWKKITALVQNCDTEIAWQGTVMKTKDAYIITNVIVPPQEVSGTTSDTDDKEYSEWLFGLPDKEFNQLRFHGHSHVDMGVFASGTDTGYRNNLVDNLPKDEFYIFMIINKSHKYSVAIWEQGTWFDQEKIKVSLGGEYDIWAEKEIKNKLKRKYPIYYQSSYDNLEGGFKYGSYETHDLFQSPRK